MFQILANVSSSMATRQIFQAKNTMLPEESVFVNIVYRKA